MTRLPAVFVLLLALNAAVAFAASRDTQWKEVDDAINKGLPKTAIEKLDPIIQGALKDKAWGEATKAITRKIVLEGNIQGNKPEEKIVRMEAAIAKAPKEIVPLLDTIQANWYWHYFLNNSWRFMQRTQTAQTPGKDFTTWDLPRLFAEIDRQFQKALANADALKKIPVSSFDSLLQKGSLPDTYRPTLYDFIAHEALKFYTAGEQAAAKPEVAFELSADGPVFDSPEKFTAWDPQRVAGIQPGGESNLPAGRRQQADDSPILKAIRLYQDILKFHGNDNDASAFIDADLERLVYGYNVAFGEEKAARYKAALDSIADKWADHELSAMARHHWARVVQSEEAFAEARAIALRGADAFPGSPGGKLCRNLISEIEAKSVVITTEHVWNCQSRAGVPPAQGNAAARPDACPEIGVRYRNLTNVYFRAVAYDWNIFLQKNHSRPENLNDAERKELLAQKPALEWSAKLPETTDYKERSEQLPAPQLEPGFYFLIASHTADFSENENQVAFTDVWVSNLALIVRPRDGIIEGFVLEANSGEPVTSAEVMAWHLDNQGNRIPHPALATDTNGFFSFKSDQNHNYLLRVRQSGRELGSQQEYAAYRDEPQRAYDQTIFFTDRAIYRPGQSIQYKGICLRVQQEKDDYKVLAGQELTVILADPNNKEIARQTHRCNDYGSFTGSFTASRDRLMGSMRIYTAQGPSGQANFHVEEYKRPKFQVALDAPKTAARLNEKVSLAGHATSYTGAAIDGARIRYRVVRDVRWPHWWAWYSGRQPQVQAGQEIAHGTATTESNGSFKVEFVAKPDPKVSEKDEASFSFSVFADVTDSAGETRSAQHSINVGFIALQATLGAADWQTDDHPVEVTIKTATLDGEPQTAEGSVKVYRLQEPAQVQRSSLASPFYPGYEPAGNKEDLSNPNNWQLGEVAAEHGFTTDAEGNAKWQVKLGAGAYRALLETQDRFGKKVTARLLVQVLDPAGLKLAIKVPNLLAAPDWSIETGNDFTALWGTGYDTGRAFIEIEHRHRMIQRYWTDPARTQQQIKQSVTEAMRGGFTLHVTRVRENRAYLESRHVDVPWSNKNLEITWEHFTSKLEPNQKETWTAVIQSRNSKPETRNHADRKNGATAVPSLPTQRSGVGGEGQGEGGKSPERAVAEMVATLYDRSLDAFTPLYWQQGFDCFRQDYTTASAVFENSLKPFLWLQGQWEQNYFAVNLRYREFPVDLVANFSGYDSTQTRYGGLGGGAGKDGRLMMHRNGLLAESAPAKMSPGSPITMIGAAAIAPAAEGKTGGRLYASDKPLSGGTAPSSGPDLSHVTARKNLNETAFFFPQLVSDSNGVVRMTFTMPEALTEWRFVGFAHDRQLRSGYLEGKTVTAKDLMVQPNPPRFLREGDILEFTVKVSNQTTNRQGGELLLTFNNALTGESFDAALGVVGQASLPASPGGVPPPERRDRSAAHRQAGSPPSTELAFDIPAKESRSFSWRIQVPDGAPFLTYKTVGSTGKVSDGEEGYLPVLSRRILVTESLPLPIRGPATKRFEFAKLLKSAKSDTLRHQNLTVQMVSNPAWYAVMALPYLMEFPHECTEQTFNRLYANALARFIANSDPKVHRVFEQWRNTPALDSPLEKNQDLKSIAIEETPWLRQAESESQARRNVGILFDDNRLNYETENTLRKLTDMQLPDGSWPWFPGGRGNDYITLYITTGFGRLRHLGADTQVDPAMRALGRLDNWIDEHYHDIQKSPRPEAYVPGATDALYLYGRSFFLKEQPVSAPHAKAVEFFLNQARKHWLKVDNRQSQGHLAIALQRFNTSTHFNDSTPNDIMKSIKERSVTDEELGMFWRETELSWWWYRAPIETQALMIEAFDEVMDDKQAVEECKVWLLKQKQTQDWKTTKATADAVYGLLLRGRDLLASDKLVEVNVGGINVLASLGRTNPKSEIEPGTGFYERRFAGPEIKSKLGDITVKKVDDGVAWGSVHWQYLEDMSKVTAYEGTPLKLKKTLFTRLNTKKGPALVAVKGPLSVGDELVVRIELRVDRDMEYIHLKDQRGSGTEPVNVISQYKYQDGLAYYESTRDTASHFFIDYLPKGAFVFEYPTRVQLRGEYQTGMAEIQCMYAPEYNSHSESIPMAVR